MAKEITFKNGALSSDWIDWHKIRNQIKAIQNIKSKIDNTYIFSIESHSFIILEDITFYIQNYFMNK